MGSVGFPPGEEAGERHHFTSQSVCVIGGGPSGIAVAK